ncbi:hypothetical protein E5F92_000110 [Flavobacterium columnare]|nr:hypothetical protein [Flavobacterium columnare]
MADFQVDSKLFALLFVCCLFFSCSSSKIKINKCENSNQWFVLDLKESKMYFNIKDVLDNIPKKKLNNEVLMKNYERIKISKDSILVAKDFYCQNQNVSENETMNFVILSESMLGLIKEGKLKVYNKKN